MPLYSHNKKETIYFKGFCAKNSGCTPTKNWWERRIDFIRQAIFAIKQKINWYKSRELTFCLLWERGGKERKKKNKWEKIFTFWLCCAPQNTRNCAVTWSERPVHSCTVVMLRAQNYSSAWAAGVPGIPLQWCHRGIDTLKNSALFTAGCLLPEHPFCAPLEKDSSFQTRANGK